MPHLSPDISATQPVLDLSRFEPSNRRRLSAPALRTFLAIADLWGLNEEQRRLMLGYPSRSTFHSWCKQAREHGSITPNVDVLTRIPLCLAFIRHSRYFSAKSVTALSGCVSRMRRAFSGAGHRSRSLPTGRRMA